MENDSRKIGKLIFKRKINAKEVKVPTGLEDINIVCLTAEYNQFVVKVPYSQNFNIKTGYSLDIEPKNRENSSGIIFKLNRETELFANDEDIDYQVQNETSYPIGKLNYLEIPELCSASRKREKKDQCQKCDYDKCNYDEKEIYRLEEDFEKLESLVDHDVERYLTYLNPESKKTKAEYLKDYKKFKKKILDYHQDKLRQLSESTFIRDLIESLRTKWELEYSRKNFSLICEKSTNIVCLENWEIENESFIQDFASLLRYAGFEEKSSLNFLLGLAVVLFGEYLDLDKGEAIFFPSFPQLHFEGEAKEMRLDIYPDTDWSDFEGIFKIIKLIRTIELGKRYKLPKGNDYSDAFIEEIVERHKLEIWEKIANDLNQQFPANPPRFNSGVLRSAVRRKRKKWGK